MARLLNKRVVVAVVPCAFIWGQTVRSPSQCDFDASKRIGQLSVAGAIGGAIVYGLRYTQTSNLSSLKSTTECGVISFLESSQSVKLRSDIGEKYTIDCNLADGAKLLKVKGPEVGMHLFNQQCRRKIANATRSDGKPKFEKQFILTGDIGKLLGVGDAFVTRVSAFQRVEGECAVLKQWLKLKHMGQGGDCSELTEQKVAEKRRLLASGIVLLALMDISFEDNAVFRAI